MAGDPLITAVSVDVKPSAQAVATIDATQAKLKTIEAQARATTAAVVQAQSVAATGGGSVTPGASPGVRLPVRRNLAAVAAVRRETAVDGSGVTVGAGGVKLGRFGTLGSGGFVLGQGAILKTAMPLLYAAGASRAAAGVIDGLATFLEESRKGGLKGVATAVGEKAADSAIAMFAPDAVAQAIVNLNRQSGGSNLMTRSELEEQEKAAKERRQKANEEASRFGEQVHSQLVSQSAGVSQSWLGQPDSYRLNRRLAETIDSVTAEARERRRVTAERTLYEAGTGF